MKHSLEQAAATVLDRGDGSFAFRTCYRVFVLSILVSLTASIAARDALGAVIPVMTTLQKIGGGGGCSLQEAIYSANFDSNRAIAGYSGSTAVEVATECVPGSGDDIIVLPAGALFSLSKIVDDADNPAGPTATPIITSNITILAYGATLQRADSSLSNFRLFAIGDSGSLTLRRAYIRGFRAKGGGGRSGGGGGMGAGGAIYVKRGGLTIEGSTFEGNLAFGGAGGTATGHSGGGGGIGGSGGIGQSTDIGGGGGGGARGDGAEGGIAGGGGGGTVRGGGGSFPYLGGFACGGQGGGSDDAGDSAPCPGGGGGGGGGPIIPVGGLIGHDGGRGSYGGGGGGGDLLGGGHRG